MQFLKLLLAFAPWLAFLVIAQGSLFRLKAGLVTALALSVVMGIAGLHRGIILWAGLAFFTFATVAVVGFESMWAVAWMGVMASGALAASTWLTVALGKPFTLDYARRHVDPSLWNDPGFVRTNVILTSVWGAVFTANSLLALGKMHHLLLPGWGYEAVSYSLLAGTAFFTTWYPERVRKARAAARP